MSLWFYRQKDKNIKNFRNNKIKYDIQNKQKIYEINDTKSFKKYTKDNKIRHNTKHFKGNVRR